MEHILHQSLEYFNTNKYNAYSHINLGGLNPLKNKLKYVIWLLLFFSLSLMFPAVKLRLSNEKNDNIVVAAADYYEFLDLTTTGDMSYVLDRLYDSNVKTIGLREITIGDLAKGGFVSILPADEISSKSYDNISSEVTGSKSKKTGLPKAAVLCNTKQAFDFLSERLNNKFTENKYEIVQAENMESDGDFPAAFYFYNLDDDHIGSIPLGFDKSLMDGLKKRGFDIMLRLGSVSFYTPGDMGELNNIIQNFDIRSIIFDGDLLPGYPGILTDLKDLILKNGITIGLIEPASQIGYTSAKGLDSLIKDIDYAVCRVSIIPQDVLSKISAEDLFFRWLRSIVDRSIRVVYITPVSNPAVSKAENINDTIDSAKALIDYISAREYVLNHPFKKLNTSMKGFWHNAAASAAIFLSLLLLILYMKSPCADKSSLHLDIPRTDKPLKKSNSCKFKKLRVIKKPIPYYDSSLSYVSCTVKITGILTLNALFLLIVLFGIFGGSAADITFALAASIIFPSLSGIMMLNLLLNGKFKSFFTKLALSPILMFSVDAIGIYIVLAELSDIRYTMNLMTYQGVPLAFTIPLLIFLVVCKEYFYRDLNIRQIAKKVFSSLFTVRGASTFAISAVIIYIYLSRSSNFSLIPASNPELEIRKLLEYTFFVRPRFKEFLIGYPSLFILLYLSDKKEGKIPDANGNHSFTIILAGLGVMVGNISIVNSFCHTYTHILISLRRTLNGFLLGIITGSVLLLIFYFWRKLQGYYTGKKGNM